jgi:hypothetical protein
MGPTGGHDAADARRLRARNWGDLAARSGFCLSSSLFRTLTGLADGLALKELRYAG